MTTELKQKLGEAEARRVALAGLVEDGAALALTIARTGWVSEARAAHLTPGQREIIAAALEDFAHGIRSGR